MYGVIFVILGNLTGNAIAMGQYIMQAAGIPNHEAAVRGIAVAALTAACLIHGLWRNGGIVLNNVLALIKVLTLTAVIVIGFAAAGGASFGNGTVGKAAVKTNFDTHKSFSRPSHDAGSYARSIVYVVYSYSGFKQPFYVSATLHSLFYLTDVLTYLSKVLSEVSQPKKRFAKATIATMILVAIMFILANVAYVSQVYQKR